MKMLRALTKRKLHYLLYLILPLIMWMILRQAPLPQIWAIFRQLQPWQWLVWAVVNVAITLLFSSRWWLILRALRQRTPYLALAGYRLAGFSIGYFTPGTQFGGEPLQVYLLEKHQEVPTHDALASVSLDKLFELLANFTFLMIGVLFIINSGALDLNHSISSLASSQALVWSGIALSLPLVYLLTLSFGKLPLNRLITFMPVSWLHHSLFKKAWTLVASTEQQISTVFRQSPLTILRILALSGLIWGLSIFEYWLALTFLGARLDLFQTISALTGARLAFLTPIPGGLGALEASQVFALQAFGFSPALGFSISLMIRLRDTFLGLAGLGLGALLLRRSKTQTNQTVAAVPLTEPNPVNTLPIQARD